MWQAEPYGGLGDPRPWYRWRRGRGKDDLQQTLNKAIPNSNVEHALIDPSKTLTAPEPSPSLCLD